MYAYQKELINSMAKFKGRGIVQITGRQTGKSVLNNMFSGQALQRLIDDIMDRPVEDLVLTEGTVYGSRYYTVEPVGGNWREMEQWCLETFGSNPNVIWGESKAPEPASRWYMNNRKFWFREEKDRDWFVIRWRA